MTTHISLDKGVVERNDVHFIPCSIDYDGRANVSSYFKVKKELEGVRTASFRGRPLFGSEVPLPEGYCGYVINKAVGPTEKSRVHDLEQSFKKITYWNLDRVPSDNDPIINALDWVRISNVIHEIVNSKELNKVNSNSETDVPHSENVA